MKHSQRGVYITVHPDLGANIVIAKFVGWDLQAQALKAHTVVVAHRALVLLAQDQICMSQVAIWAASAIGVTSAGLHTPS
jgi:hypothetical protein